MFLLKKVFQLRDKANPDEEKPFLEHLEDLRVTITRIVVTLLITTIICFTYRDTLMEILRKPIYDVWEKHSDSKLPKHKLFDADHWEQAKSSADAMALLPDDAKEHYLSQLKDGERHLMRIVIAYKTAVSLPEDRRETYLNNIAGYTDEDRTLFKELLEKKPDTQAGSRDRFRFMSTLNPTEAFMLSMKLAFFAGIVIAFPLLLLYTLQFILPGLHEKEKKALYPALVVGFGLFICGVLFAYLWVLPSVLEFFYSYGESMGIANDWRIGSYLSFATQFTMIFGLCFELPVVVWVLVKIGLLNYEVMSRTRSYAILAIVIIAAIITPTPDAFTLLLLAAPMIVLYEISIWLAWFDARKEKKREQDEENERLQRMLEREKARQEKSSDSPDEHDEHDKHDEPKLLDTEEGEEMDMSDPIDSHQEEADRENREEKKIE